MNEAQQGQTGTEPRTHLYTSENGDNWSLCQGADGVAAVLHEPNPKSGGQPSLSSIPAFLAERRNGPEHQALRRVIAQGLAGPEAFPAQENSLAQQEEHILRRLGAAVC